MFASDCARVYWLPLQLSCCSMVAAKNVFVQPPVHAVVCCLASSCCMPPSKLPFTASRACLGQGVFDPILLSGMPSKHYFACSTLQRSSHHYALTFCLACLSRQMLLMQQVVKQLLITMHICMRHASPFFATFMNDAFDLFSLMGLLSYAKAQVM